MKINEISKILDKLGKDKEAITQLLDLAIAKEMEKFNLRLNSVKFKIDMLVWAFTVVFLGVIVKMLLGI